MRTDPLPAVVWKLNLNGQPAGFLSSVEVPTDTTIALRVGLLLGDVLSDWAFQEMQGQRSTKSGNLITLDSRLNPVYNDAWDSSFIQKAEISSLDVSRNELLTLALTLQVTNLREVDLPAPGGNTVGPISRTNSRKSLLKQRLFNRTIRSNVLGTQNHRKDPLPSFCFKLGLSGSTTQLFVKSLGPLSYSSGVIAPVVISLVETAAGEFRAWNQSGGQKDITVQVLNTALQLAFTIVLVGCTIAQIAPPVPINPGGQTSITLNVSSFTISY